MLSEPNMNLVSWFNLNTTYNNTKIVVGSYRFVSYKFVAFLFIASEGQTFDPAHHLLGVDMWVDAALHTDWVPIGEGETLELALSSLTEKMEFIQYSPEWHNEIRELYDDILKTDTNECCYDKPITKTLFVK